MPIYEYRCGACGFQNEYLQKVSDPVLTTCPECGKATFRKQLTAAGFQLKGSGWYATDFKHNGSRPAAKQASAEKKADGEAGTGGADSKSGGESKTETGSKPSESAACGAGACPSCS